VSLLRRAIEERSINLTGLDDPRLALRASGMGGLSWSGVPITQHTALQLTTVWACVTLLADTISSLPVGAFRSPISETARLPIKPSPPLLQRPHPELDTPAWLNQELVSLLMRGNGYGRVVEYDKNTYPSAIKVLSPDDVQPKRDKISGLIMYKIRGEAELQRAYPVGPIVHQRGLTLPGGVIGLAPIEYARQGIGLGLAAEEYGGRYFGESANPTGVLATDQEMSEQAAKTVLTNWVKSHGNRSRIPAVLTGGMKWQAIGVTPEESQFLATRAYTRQDIAQLFRVPLHMISIMDKSTSWGTGIEEQTLGFLTFTLMPWIIRLESMLTEMLPRGQFAKFNVASLLRGRLLDRYDAYLKGRTGGWLSINDILRLEDMAPIAAPEGDDHIQPLNMAPISMIEDILTKPSAELPAPKAVPTEEAPAI